MKNQRLKTIINKVKEIDMNNIKEIKDYYEIIDKLIDMEYNIKGGFNIPYLEVKVLLDKYRKKYVKKEL